MLIHKTFRYKLKPTGAQESRFYQFAGATRWVWNVMLAEQNRRRVSGEKRLSLYDMMRWLTELKRTADYGWLTTIHSQVLQEPIKHLDTANQNAFAKRAKVPKFKSRHKHMSFAYPQSVRVQGNQVYLPKIGWVRFRKSREVEGTLKSATITQQASGWYVSILCEVEVQEYGDIPLHDGNTVGIDLGLTSFLVSSAGDDIPAPHYYRKAQQKLAKAQRALSRKQKGSNRRKKQAHKVARLHEQVANQRRDFLHKLSTALVGESQAIIAEDLNVRGLGRTRFAKSVHDVGWGMFLRMVAYKTEWQSKVFHQVNRFFPSSKTCYSCETRNPLALSDRTFVCNGCGTTLLRDLNAARNIKRRGLLDLSPAGTSGVNAHGADVRPLSSGIWR
jgi:putative transposase